MKMKVERSVYAAMLRAAQMAAPQEACGLCGGAEGWITRFYEIANADASGEHFSMRPEDQFSAVRDMRARGVEMRAIWHSHPATPARMSDEDVRLAYTPGAVYMITSLARPDAPVTRGFLMDGGTPLEVPIEMCDGKGDEG